MVLEMFFDNEKVFSVFEKILKSEEEEINCVRICFDLGVPPMQGAEILSNFEFLGILDECDKPGYFRLNKDSEVVMGLCFFDEIVAKHCMKSVFRSSDKNGNNGEGVIVEQISFEDFLKDILGKDIL